MEGSDQKPLGRVVAEAVVTTVAVPMMVVLAEQLRDPDSWLRTMAAQAWERARDAFRLERYRAHVEAQMHDELNQILEGETQ